MARHGRAIGRREQDRDTQLAINEIVGASTSMRSLKQVIASVATTDATVLIHGETGTRKQLAARAIHRKTERDDYERFSVYPHQSFSDLV